MEFWNNPGRIDSIHGFRITLNLYKPLAQPDSLYFYLHGQTYDRTIHTYVDYWTTWNSTFYVPTGKWMDMEVNFVEGDDVNGQFYLVIKPG